MYLVMSQKIMGPQNSTKISKNFRKRLKKYCEDDEFVDSFYVLYNFFYWYASAIFDTFIPNIYLVCLSGISSSYYFGVLCI